MKYILIFLFLVFTIHIYSQDIVSVKPEDVNQEFSETEWSAIQKRWDKKQPYAHIVLQSGDRINGQLMYANSNNLIIYPSNTIMINQNQFRDTLNIPIGNIRSINLVKNSKRTILAGVLTGTIVGGSIGIATGLIIGGGWSFLPALVLGTVGIVGGGFTGSAIQKHYDHTTINLGSGITDKKLKKINKYAIYKDTVFYSEFSKMRSNSKLTRKIFPKKHFRVYVGGSAGFSTTKKDLEQLFNSTELPEIAEFRYAAFNFEMFNFSWRFNKKYIVGWNMFLYGNSHTYLFAYESTASSSLNYNYTIEAYGTSLYGDYVINPIDEYFTKRTELSVGVGLLHLNPYVKFNYTNFEGSNEYITNFDKEYSIYGLQLRTSASYYLFPGFSLNIGLQANLYQNITVSTLALHNSDPAKTIQIPEHKLGFSSIRASFGLGIHF